MLHQFWLAVFPEVVLGGACLVQFLGAIMKQLKDKVYAYLQFVDLGELYTNGRAVILDCHGIEGDCGR